MNQFMFIHCLKHTVVAPLKSPIKLVVLQQCGHNWCGSEVQRATFVMLDKCCCKPAFSCLAAPCKQKGEAAGVWGSQPVLWPWDIWIMCSLWHHTEPRVEQTVKVWVWSSELLAHACRHFIWNLWHGKYVIDMTENKDSFNIWLQLLKYLNKSSLVLYLFWVNLTLFVHTRCCCIAPSQGSMLHC